MGRVVITPTVKRTLEKGNPDDWRDELKRLLWRHSAGGWGEVNAGEAQTNEVALKKGGPLSSAYTTGAGSKVRVITESDRSVTTILLSEDP
jgi:hypothetical protein